MEKWRINLLNSVLPDEHRAARERHDDRVPRSCRERAVTTASCSTLPVIDAEVYADRADGGLVSDSEAGRHRAQAL